MSKTWKWILGIVLGLFVLAGVSFAAAYYFGFGHMTFRVGPAFSGRPMMDDYGFRDRLPMDGFRGFRHPMMGGRGFGGYGFIGLPFLFVGGLFRLIFPLAVLALVAYFSYRAGKNAGMRAMQAMPQAGPALDAEPEEPPKQRGRKVT